MSTTWRQFDLSASYEEGEPVPAWIPSTFIELAGREIINHPDNQERYFGKLTDHQSPGSRFSLYKLKDENEEGSEIRVIEIPGPFDPNTQPVVMGVDMTRKHRNIVQPVPHLTPAPGYLDPRSHGSQSSATRDYAQMRNEYGTGQSLGPSRNLRSGARNHRRRQGAQDHGKANWQDVLEDAMRTLERNLAAIDRDPQSSQRAFLHSQNAAQETFSGDLSPSQSTGGSSLDQEIKTEFDEDGVHIGRNLSNVTLSGDFSYVAGNTIHYGPGESVQKVIRGPTLNAGNITFF